MAIKGGKFFISHHRPLGPQSSKPFEPSLAILTIKTGGFPDQEEPVVGKQRLNAPHKILLFPGTEMVKGLTNPCDMDRFIPGIDASTKS